LDVVAHVALGALHVDAQQVTTSGRLRELGSAAARERGVSESRSHLYVDRLLSDRKLDALALQRRLVAHFANAMSEVVVSLETLCFEPDGHRSFVLLIIDEHGRALPVMWQSFSEKNPVATRREVEETLLANFAAALPAHVQRVTVMCERELSECAVFESLQARAKLDFIVRLPATTNVQCEGGEVRSAAEWSPSNGHPRYLTRAKTQAKGLLTAGVVCVKRAKMQDAWCLATSRTDQAERLVDLYAKRMLAIADFQSSKTERTGVGLYLCTMSSVARRDRLLLALLCASLVSALCQPISEAVEAPPQSRVRTARLSGRAIAEQIVCA
jgi:hypothetical protein